jgi:hypothetical protein
MCEPKILHSFSYLYVIYKLLLFIPPIASFPFVCIFVSFFPQLPPVSPQTTPSGSTAAGRIMRANGIKTVQRRPLQDNKGFRLEEKMFVKKASWQAS